MTLNRDRALALLDAFPRLRVAVIGDLMLDRYIAGPAKRISPEAPVPVVRVHQRWSSLGGAANVMRNLTSLGARARGYGLVGRDPAGDELLALCTTAGIDVAGVQRLPQRPTTVKTRLIAHNQQVARIDDEDDRPLAPAARRRLAASLAAAVAAAQVDAIVIEDYHKGVITRGLGLEVLRLAATRGLPTALDPHPGSDYVLPGLTLMTPNRAEAFALARAYLRPTVTPLAADRPLLAVGRRLLRRWRPAHLLITLGADGMALFQEQAPLVHLPTVAREVYDVSGAGDTVIATWTLAHLAGASPREACELANLAAGIVVAKVGTVPVEIAELHAAAAALPAG